MRIRLAEAADAPRIVEILQEGIPADRLGRMIFGCPGIVDYMTDLLRRQDFSNSQWYVAEHESSGTLGVAEIRRTSSALFLNHIFVTPAARGSGAGTVLLRQALRLARDGDQSHIELDVFGDNHRVRGWYRGLGFLELYETWWVEMATVGQKPGQRSPWHTSGLGQADRIHASYGFSEFGLETRAGGYRVGRLGDDRFRVTDAAVLADPWALEALHILDGRRSLLCIDRATAFPQPLSPGAGIKATAYRMRAEVESVLRDGSAAGLVI